MKSINKKIIVTILVIIEIMLINITYKSYSNRIVDEKEIENKKVAIKVDNGNNEYEDSERLPGEGYVINDSLTECFNQEGKKEDGNLISNGESITLTSNKTLYCTLYFRKLKSLGNYCNTLSMNECLKNKIDTIEEVDFLTDSLKGGMYRYQGIDNVNNYICFGTSSKEECLANGDKYMYRIIGITEDGQIELIKATALIEGGTFGFSQHNQASTEECGINGENCTWPKSRLFNRLNGLCNEENINGCTGTTKGWDGDTNIFIGNSYYEYLQDNTWYDKIVQHEWKYGDIDAEIALSYNGDIAYENEKLFEQSVQAKIGLRYLYDCFYAQQNDNSIISWLVENYSERLITRFDMVRSWLSNSEGFFSYSFHSSDITRPVFYLDSNIKLSDSMGTRSDPFIIMN